MNDDALAIQTRLLQDMSAERKLRIAGQLRDAAWELTAVGLRRRHPELAEEAIQEWVLRVFTDARS